MKSQSKPKQNQTTCKTQQKQTMNHKKHMQQKNNFQNNKTKQATQQNNKTCFRKPWETIWGEGFRNHVFLFLFLLKVFLLFACFFGFSLFFVCFACRLVLLSFFVVCKFCVMFFGFALAFLVFLARCV